MEKRKSGVQKKIVQKDRKFLKQALDYLASDTYMYAPLIACSLHSSTFTPSSPSTEKEVPVRQLQISRIADDQRNRRTTANLKFVLAQLVTENVEAASHILQRQHDPRTNGQTPCKLLAWRSLLRLGLGIYIGLHNHLRSAFSWKRLKYYGGMLKVINM